MRTYLFNSTNIDATRKYFLDDLGLGLNLPIYHIEETILRGYGPFDFLTVTYTYNQKGLYAIQGKMSYDSGRMTILEANILYVFDYPGSKSKTEDLIRWMYHNFPIMKKILGTDFSSAQRAYVERQRQAP